jgi:hypothetical protein
MKASFVDFYGFDAVGAKMDWYVPLLPWFIPLMRKEVS